MMLRNTYKKTIMHSQIYAFLNDSFIDMDSVFDSCIYRYKIDGIVMVSITTMIMSCFETQLVSDASDHA